MQDAPDRAGRANSLNILMEYYWIYLSKISSAVQDHLGDQGTETLFNGLRRYGHFRGERMRNSAQVCAEGRDALSLMRGWDVADFMLASDGDRMQVVGTPKSCTAKLNRIPGYEYGPARTSPDLLQRYWDAVLTGIAEGFDDDLTLNLNEHALECTFSGEVANRSDATPEDTLADPTTCISLSRSTLGDFAAMTMYTGQALLDRYDATGEKVLREALYAFGVERAKGMRDAVQAEGKPLNFETWFDTMQKRDPNASAFVFRGDYVVSPGVFQVRCTFCPCADTWAEEGHKGLSFGQIYDLEVHRGLVEGFHPDGIVAWDTLKTRGDKTCNFRFYIPQLVSEDDPKWAREKANGK